MDSAQRYHRNWPPFCRPRARVSFPLPPHLRSILLAYAADLNVGAGLPVWAHLLCALLTFVFQTADALDGIQARKTRAGSSCGDFIDHTADVVSVQTHLTCFMGLLLCGRHHWITWSGQILTLCNSWSHSWEAKHLHTFTHEEGGSITDGQVCVILLHIACPIIGPLQWQSIMHTTIPMLPFTVGATTVVLINLVVNVSAITRKLVRALKSHVAFGPAIRSFIPGFGVIIASFLCYWSIPIEGRPGHEYALLLFMACAAAGVRVEGELNLSRLTRQPERIVLTCIAVLLALATNFTWGPFIPLLHAMVATVTILCAEVVFFNWAVLTEMSRALRISLWTVPKLKA